jgi:hypothetical protein
MTTEARLYWDELKPGMQKLLNKLFNIVNRHVYGGKLSKMEKSKFLYTIGGTTDLKDVIKSITLYMNSEMYKKALPLTYLSAIIRNSSERKEITLKAERKLRGHDPPGGK